MNHSSTGQHMAKGNNFKALENDKGHTSKEHQKLILVLCDLVLVYLKKIPF